MDNKNISLTPENLCAIIEACGKAGVTEFEFNKLKIKFIGEANHAEISVKTPIVDDSLVAQVEGEALLRDELEVRESQLAQAMIENPEGFEELLLNGELDGTEHIPVEQQI